LEEKVLFVLRSFKIICVSRAKISLLLVAALIILTFSLSASAGVVSRYVENGERPTAEDYGNDDTD